MLLLHEFEFKVVHGPGTPHPITSFLYCLDLGKVLIGIVNELLNAHLFAIFIL